MKIVRFLMVYGISLLLVGANISCESAGKNTAIGAGVGAAAGAAVGAIVGHQTGNRGQGALIGAAIGAGIGGVAGNRLDKQQKELAKIAETKRTEQGLITKLKSDILFDSGKSDLKPQAKQNIGQLASIMKKYPENVLTIKGYTDNTGTRQTNEKLSASRAEAVKRALIESGMPATTMGTVGMADDNPISANDNKDGRAQNRRVEIEITVDESKIPKDAKG